MHYLKRLYAAAENRVLDLLVSGRLLTKKTPPEIATVQASVPTDWYFLRQVFKEFSFGPNDHILDVGCGSGRAVLFLGRRFPTATVRGIELNKSVAAFAQEVIGRKHEIIVGDILADCPSDTNVFYLFNPFHKQVMTQFCETVLNTRDAYTVIYTVPVYLDTMIKICTGNVNVCQYQIKSTLRALDRGYAVVTKTADKTVLPKRDPACLPRNCVIKPPKI